MENPIIIETYQEDGKTWPIYHQFPVCAKSNKLAQECFKISGCEGECLNHVCTIPWDDGPGWTKGNPTQLWVLNTLILFN